MLKRILWTVSGCASVLALWLLVVPWDLSEVDRLGRGRPGGGDDAVGRIITVVAVAAIVGAALAYRRRGDGIAFLCGAYVATLALFAWRTSTARVEGANFWLIALQFLAVGVGLAFAAAQAIGNYIGRSRTRHVDP